MKLIRFCFFGMNFVLLAAGIAVIGLSIWSFIEARGFVLNSLYVTTSILSILTGVSFIVLSVTALIGYKNHVRIFLQLYFLVVCCLTIVLITCVTCAFLFKNSLSTSFRNLMISSVKRYFTSKFVQDSWDTIQSRFKCCGISSEKGFEQAFDVWKQNPSFNRVGGPYIPESCCVQELINGFASYYDYLIQCQREYKFMFPDDCYDKLKEYVKPRTEGIAYSALTTIVICIVVVLLTWMVLKEKESTPKTREGQETVQHVRKVRKTFPQDTSSSDGIQTKIPIKSNRLRKGSEEGGVTRGQRPDVKEHITKKDVSLSFTDKSLDRMFTSKARLQK